MNYQVLEETYQSLITDPNKKEWLENNWKEIMTEFSDLLIEKVESSVEPDKVKVLEKILMENKISNAHKILVEFETALKEQETNNNDITIYNWQVLWGCVYISFG